MAVNHKKITDQYAIYNGDCMMTLPEFEKESMDLSIYSPPFAGLFHIQAPRPISPIAKAKSSF